jgi:nucleotide-binding universal stress UspA family protein
MYKILVPVDGSDCALRALEHAIERAREVRGSSLHVLTVHPEPRVYGETAVFLGKERMEQLASQHDVQVLSGAEEMLNRTDVPFTTEALKATPPKSSHAVQWRPVVRASSWEHVARAASRTWS